MAKKLTFLAVDLDHRNSIAQSLSALLASSCFIHVDVEEVFLPHPNDAMGWESRLSDATNGCDLILLGLSHRLVQSPGRLLDWLREAVLHRPILVVAQDAEPNDILNLLGAGAADFITDPINRANVLPRIWRLLDQHNEERSSVQSLKEKLGLKQLVGESRVFLNELRKIPLVARCDTGVVICGETGTGKELVARAIHYLSPRAANPFVPIDCGAIPVELAESELFGHEKGAYTGAVERRNGLIPDAENGTVFLDDVDCLPFALQSKLLRFLQEKQFRVLGSSRLRTANVRVIAASNTDLTKAVEGGRFRRDLYYRLNIIPICLPALRERPTDIPLLARYFVGKYTEGLDQPPITLAADAVQKLLLHRWPGNVRELQHVIENAVVLSGKPVLHATDLKLPVEQKSPPDSFRQAKARVVARFERDYIERLLRAYDGNISRAAGAAQKNRRAFWELIRKHGINVGSFRSPA